MRKALVSLYSFFGVALLVVFSMGVCVAQSRQSDQNRERFVISATAGGVNAVTGRIGVHARGSSVWEQLTIKDNLQGGDVVKTGLDGRVEILLNPGSYMRVGEDSEFELTSNSLDNLEVRLIRGTAIVEATGADDTELLINITTPHARMAIVRRGLYRVNVVPGDLTELIVRKGRVLLADPETKVKGGKKLIFSRGSHSVAKLTDAEKKSIDSFDVWSKERAETVAKANQRMSSRDRNSLRSGYYDHLSSMFSSRLGGIWLYERSWGCYTFLPFFAGWGSPYGSSYTVSFHNNYWWRLRNPGYDQRVYYPSARDTVPTSIQGKSISIGPPASSSPRHYPKGGSSKMPIP